ncbi:MAG: hypothetical protein F4X26_00890 [Chloroflexi bacterium]|nr:hypothetical protein [Chloroflexota bacterium]
MIELGVFLMLVVGGFLGLVITQSFFSQRHWRRIIAEGDLDALRASVLEAFETWRRMRPPPDVPPADWRALVSAELIAADTERCRVSLLAEPDIRVVDGVREQIGPPSDVARRSAVRMAERLLYDIPLARFEAVQVDVYAEYRSSEGEVESECLLTTQVSRGQAVITDWDDDAAPAILKSWSTREAGSSRDLDPGVGALITADADAGTRANGATPAGEARP